MGRLRKKGRVRGKAGVTDEEDDGRCRPSLVIKGRGGIPGNGDERVRE